VKREQKLTFTVAPGGELQGYIRVPGDKSISHRSIMLGALADGITEVEGFLEGEDSQATLQAFQAMGVRIDRPAPGKLTIHGVGMEGLSPPAQAIDLGNSGTSMRLLCGILAAQNFDVILQGDASLMQRPMKRVTQPLAQMGADIITTEAGMPPLKIHGGHPLTAIQYELPIASAQVKSALLLAGLYAVGETCVTEPAPTRDHTERMLTAFSYPTKRNGSQVCLEGGGRLTATRIEVPADISSAAFFMVGAALSTNSSITLEKMGVNPTRIGIINILRLMGADIHLSHERFVGGEPIADIRICGGTLRGIEIPMDQVPLAIDEFPAIFIAAACANGTTVLTGAEELRVKESDRIQVMADGLNELGIHAQATADGMIIEGGMLKGGTVDSHGDHRIAMAFSIAALRASGQIQILNCANVATSFPGFIDTACQAGLKLSAEA